MKQNKYALVEPACKNREGCAVQMDLFAQIIKSTAKEFEDSILIDVRMEKKFETAAENRGKSVGYDFSLYGARKA